jgi:hypothetical protein
MSPDELYVNKRERINKEIDGLFEQGEKCGFTPDQVVDDILDHISNEHGISCSQD